MNSLCSEIPIPFSRYNNTISARSLRWQYGAASYISEVTSGSDRHRLFARSCSVQLTAAHVESGDLKKDIPLNGRGWQLPRFPFSNVPITVFATFSRDKNSRPVEKTPCPQRVLTKWRMKESGHAKGRCDSDVSRSDRRNRLTKGLRQNTLAMAVTPLCHGIRNTMYTATSAYQY